MAQYPLIDPFTHIKSIALTQSGTSYDIGNTGGFTTGLSHPCGTLSGGSWWFVEFTLAFGEAVPTSFSGKTMAGSLGGSVTFGTQECVWVGSFVVYTLPLETANAWASVNTATGAIVIYRILSGGDWGFTGFSAATLA